MVLGLLLAGALAAGSPPTVVATDLETGRTLLCRPLPGGARLTLAFTHSMYGGDVREAFVPTADGRLRRVALSTANAAAADYYAYTAGVVREGDRFRVDVPAAEYDEVVVRVDRIGDHRLLLGGDVIALVEAAGDGHRVALRARSMSSLARLAGRGC